MMEAVTSAQRGFSADRRVAAAAKKAGLRCRTSDSLGTGATVQTGRWYLTLSMAYCPAGNRYTAICGFNAVANPPPLGVANRIVTSVAVAGVSRRK